MVPGLSIAPRRLTTGVFPLMPTVDAFQRLFAWALGLGGMGFAARAIWAHAAHQRQMGKPYSMAQRLGDAAMPLALSIMGARFLLLGYGVLAPEDPAVPLLAGVATVMFVGGYAAARIRRGPG